MCLGFFFLIILIFMLCEVCERKDEVQFDFVVSVTAVHYLEYCTHVQIGAICSLFEQFHFMLLYTCTPQFREEL